MENVQWVKPLSPEMIPDGHRAVWNNTTEEWEFFVVEDPNDIVIDFPTPTE